MVLMACGVKPTWPITGTPRSTRNAMVSAMRTAALELDRAAAGFLQHARRGRERLLLRGLVRTERQVDDHQRALRAAHHRVTLQDHHVERDRHGGFEPVHHHAERIADQNDVAIAVEDARGMRMIGRQADDRLAALAAPMSGAVSRRISSCTDIGQCPSAGVPKAGTPMTSGWNTKPSAR